MKAVTHFIIKTKKTHKDKVGSIHLLERFENQGKAIQYHELLAVPERHKDIAEVGDVLVCHFNVVVFDRKNGVSKKGRYFIQDNMYWVQDDMAHFVIRKNGDINFLHEQCLVEGQIGKDEEVTEGGIILIDARSDAEKKHDTMKGTVIAKAETIEDVEVGDLIGLSDHSDYEIEMPDGTVKWLVDYHSMLFKYDD